MKLLYYRQNFKQQNTFTTRTCEHISRWTVLIVCDQLSEDFFVILPVAILKMQKPVRARPTTLNAIALLQRIKRL